MSIKEWYMCFLTTSESSLRKWVDLYNQGFLGSSENARIALEIIDGLPIDD